MHIQIVNFNLRDLTHEDYSAFCEEIAPQFAAVPGLKSKTWLADRETNTYGGIYVWDEPTAMQRFAQSELFAAVAAHPNLAGLTSVDFGVLEAPSRVTRGIAAEPVSV